MPSWSRQLSRFGSKILPALSSAIPRIATTSSSSTSAQGSSTASMLPQLTSRDDVMPQGQGPSDIQPTGWYTMDVIYTIYLLMAILLVAGLIILFKGCYAILGYLKKKRTGQVTLPMQTNRNDDDISN